MTKTNPERIHLVTGGDSFFGATRVGCSEPPGGEQGVFGFDDTLWRVNCRKCMASKEYREMCKEQGKEHPFSKAARKAYETRHKKQEDWWRTALGGMKQ